MCGIAGLMTKDGNKIQPATLDRLIEALAHRGPDGEGKYITGNVALIQTRLAIIDLKTGDQPLYEPSGCVLVGNGEIYNYLELKKEFPADRFQTKSDCEPPLALYKRDGEEFATALRGMYALALHDPQKDQLLITRDPFGIKPLYYIENENYFAFASEAQALTKAGLCRAEIDDRHRDELLQLQFTCRSETIFKGIRRVFPGETIIVKRGHIVARHRRPALPAGGPEKISPDAALKRLDETLRQSVELHQRSDVPYGLFLSGGIDSSVLLALMAQLNQHPITAYTAGFSGTAVHDERAHARALAKSVNADHHEVEFDEKDFWASLPAIAARMDDPAADYAILPTWKLAREAARDFKVVLCGEGGDELLAGYGRYRSALRPWWLGGRTIRHRGRFEGLQVLKEKSRAWRDAITGQEVVADIEGRNALQIAQATDCADWLTNDLLIKLDRCLMAHGLEGRTPFLDTEVARVTFRLPDSLKIQKRLGKWILRCWLQNVMPQARPFEKKRGFAVPVGEWIHSRADHLAPLLSAQESIRQIASPSRVEAIIKAGGKREGLAAWTLLFYALWHRANIEGIKPGDGSVFDILEFS